jgi:hypothetical protein
VNSMGWRFEYDDLPVPGVGQIRRLSAAPPPCVADCKRCSRERRGARIASRPANTVVNGRWVAFRRSCAYLQGMVGPEGSANWGDVRCCHDVGLVSLRWSPA